MLTFRPDQKLLWTQALSCLHTVGSRTDSKPLAAHLSSPDLKKRERKGKDSKVDALPAVPCDGLCVG